QNRPFAAARRYHCGLAPRIVIFRVKPSPATERALMPTEQELTRLLLIAEGVPADAIIEIGHDVASTRDEARATRAWAGHAKPRALILTTDPFHTRRVHWLFRKTLQGTSTTSLTTTAAPRPEYTARNWWTTEPGLIDFQNEVIKYLFYRFTE
ncbi:MAG: YdcF family protein, partial [Luteolibacter sp.]